MRDEFWATRVDGDLNMWLSLRRACDAILSEDLGLAEALLDASGLKTAEGSIAACFDERGFAYKLPTYCFCNPVDIAVSGNDQSKIASDTSASESNDVSEDDNHDKNSSDLITIKVRINPGEKNAEVRCCLSSTVLLMRKRVSQLEEMTSMDVSVNRLRLIFMGRELKDDKELLRDVKIDESRVLQVFIRPLK